MHLSRHSCAGGNDDLEIHAMLVRVPLVGTREHGHLQAADDTIENSHLRLSQRHCPQAIATQVFYQKIADVL